MPIPMLSVLERALFQQAVDSWRRRRVEFGRESVNKASAEKAAELLRQVDVTEQQLLNQIWFECGLHAPESLDAELDSVDDKVRLAVVLMKEAEADIQQLLGPWFYEASSQDQELLSKSADQLSSIADALGDFSRGAIIATRNTVKENPRKLKSLEKRQAAYVIWKLVKRHNLKPVNRNSGLIWHALGYYRLAPKSSRTNDKALVQWRKDKDRSVSNEQALADKKLMATVLKPIRLDER